MWRSPGRNSSPQAKARAVEAAARRELPLRLGRQRLALPRRERLRVRERDVHDGMIVRAPSFVLSGPYGWRQSAPRTYCHQFRDVGQIHGPARLHEHQRARVQHLGQRARVVGGVRAASRRTS